MSAKDLRLREDVALLADEGIIELPSNTWPIPVADLQRAVNRAALDNISDLALSAAYARVRTALSLSGEMADWKVREFAVAAGRAGLFRSYGTPSRENGEVTVRGGAATERYGIVLKASASIDPNDGKHLRFDGSELAFRLGNWVVGANLRDRWWGPGYDGGLILTTNARPMPTLSIDRVRSEPFDLPLLRWLGPWRFSAFLGVGENKRPDVERPAFLGMRLTFKPNQITEIGLSRTAQFCGRGRDCGLNAFWRVLIGRDNRGIRGLDDPDKEPGNQMAGADIRLVSPFKSIPVAFYAELIGEDNSSTGIPERYLGLFGGESWFMLNSGSLVRSRIEYANTKAKWYQTRDNYNIAYHQRIFSAGYRYFGRNIGHTTDSDSETASIGISLSSVSGKRLGLLMRHGRLDRCCTVDPHNTVTAGPSRYRSFELNWEGEFGTHGLAMQIGHEKQWPRTAGNANGLFGFARWRKNFN